MLANLEANDDEGDLVHKADKVLTKHITACEYSFPAMRHDAPLGGDLGILRRAAAQNVSAAFRTSASLSLSAVNLCFVGTTPEQSEGSRPNLRV